MSKYGYSGRYLATVVIGISYYGGAGILTGYYTCRRYSCYRGIGRSPGIHRCRCSRTGECCRCAVTDRERTRNGRQGVHSDGSGIGATIAVRISNRYCAGIDAGYHTRIIYRGDGGIGRSPGVDGRRCTGSSKRGGGSVADGQCASNRRQGLDSYCSSNRATIAVGIGNYRGSRCNTRNYARIVYRGYGGIRRSPWIHRGGCT